MLSPFKTRRLLALDPVQEFADTQNTRASEAVTFEDSAETQDCRISHTVAGGIERVHCLPHKPNGQPPLLMMHGMWHAAFCWRAWQETLARAGWESTAFSLPGHGRSPEQRPVAECSMPYYLRFLADEVALLERPPVLIGHSMGGALVQWYLRYVGELPAMVFVASWTAHDILKDCMKSAMTLDPSGTLLSPFLGWQYQFRNDTVVRKWFLSQNAGDAAALLRPQLGPESEIVLMQHRPPKWTPPQTKATPKLWLTAMSDAIIPVAASHEAAAHYGADLINIAGSGHDIMLDLAAQTSAQNVANWLAKMFNTTQPR